MYWTEEYDDLFKKAVEGAEAAKKLLEEIDCDGCCEECYLDYGCMQLKEMRAGLDQMKKHYERVTGRIYRALHDPDANVPDYDLGG